MATTADFRNGFTFKMDGDIWQIIEFQHVKMGRGGAIVRTKLKNLRTGRVLDKTFRSGEKVEDVLVEKRPMQFLYKSGDDYIFMDNETYEQSTISKEMVGEAAKYLREGEVIEIAYSGNQPVYLELPTAVELTVTHTEPGIKGDTVSGGGKPATLETGAVVTVPLFINEGDVIKIDTRTGEYIERVKA